MEIEPERLQRAWSAHDLPDAWMGCTAAAGRRILGARRVAAAVPALIAAVGDGGDPYLAAEAARALVAIGAPEGLAVARRLAADGPVVARAAARQALNGLDAAP
jgi:HEAT repeat protein